MARLAGRVAALKVQSDSTKTGKTAKASQATTARAAR